jgi:uncharacterized protein YegL
MTTTDVVTTSGQGLTTQLKTNVIFILDESGSMSATASDVRGGFNTYIEKIRDDGNDYSLSVIKFGTTVRPLFANQPLDQAPQLTELNYMPLDSTALYDAIGFALSEAQKYWGTDEKPYGTDRFIVIIMTDGFENASKKFTKEEIIAKIKQREEAGNWTFVYMGADQDAWAVASNLGFAQGNVMSYASASTATTFGNLATSTTTASSTTSTQTRGFFTGGN